jgi:peptidoglycan/xylan/chitin deacetylase (PgdA/CDA1 family)
MLKNVFYIFFLFFFVHAKAQLTESRFTFLHGAIVRGDSTRKELALVFTADEYGEGLPTIIKTLQKAKVKGSFFFTGRFYRNKDFQKGIKKLAKEAHYPGPHSDQHLLYCDWNKRDSLLVTKDSFDNDITQNIGAMIAAGLPVLSPHYFIPPYEWWNNTITEWSKKQGLTIINFTPGIRTNADYTWPEIGAAYKSSDWIMNWLKDFTAIKPTALNGAIILIHAGTDPRRKDKLYNRLNELITFLKATGYSFKRIDELL